LALVVGGDLCADLAGAVSNLLFGEENLHTCGGGKDGSACLHKASVARVGGRGKGRYT
jgi:hypothetical protein